MIPLGNHGLSCLSDTDPAATALYMQDQAIIIDNVLDGISDSFDAYARRPGALWQATGTTTITSTSVYSAITINSTVYSNFTVNAGGSFTTPRAGWWQTGANANMAPSGATTAGSFRRLKVVAQFTPSLLSPPTILNTAEDLSFDTGVAGGEWLSVSGGSFYLPAGANVGITAQVSHGNAASSMVVAAGARLWCWFIGSGIEIGSA